MNVELLPSDLVLARDGMVAVRDARGTRITCLTGALWITQDNYANDFIIGPGESHTVDYAGLTLVSALEPSTLSLRPAPAPWGQRILASVAHRLATLLPRPSPL
jgi:hypothetical protein